MEFNLIQDWLVTSIRPQINKHAYGTVGDSNVLNQAGVNKALKFSPYLVSRSVLDGLSIFPDHLGSHPVDKIEVDILEFQFLEGSSESSLDVVLSDCHSLVVINRSSLLMPAANTS